MNKVTSIESDETTAIEALSFLAGDPDHLGRFLALAGIDVDGLREAAAQPGFLVAVMDHLMQDEALLLAFAQASGRRPEKIAAAARRLGAGAPERDLP